MTCGTKSEGECKRKRVLVCRKGMDLVPFMPPARACTARCDGRQLTGKGGASYPSRSKIWFLILSTVSAVLYRDSPV